MYFTQTYNIFQDRKEGREVAITPVEHGQRWELGARWRDRKEGGMKGWWNSTNRVVIELHRLCTVGVHTVHQLVTFLCICIYICIYTYTCNYVYTCLHVYVHVFINTYTYIHINIYTCKYIYMHKYIYLYVHIWHTHEHVHVHIYIQALKRSSVLWRQTLWRWALDYLQASSHQFFFFWKKRYIEAKGPCKHISRDCFVWTVTG